MQASGIDQPDRAWQRANQPHMDTSPHIYGFGIAQWSTWAPGLTSDAAWLQWFDSHHCDSEPQQPHLADMPPMMRRRARLLGRSALQCTYWTRPASHDSALIFASRYGEMSRTLDLLRTLASGDPLSPADFSMSVHNAIAALYSIAEKHTGQYSAIAAGEETLEAAFSEAFAMLASEQSEVIVVHYDDSLPPPYQGFEQSTLFPRASAWRLQRSTTPDLSLSCLPAITTAPRAEQDLPPDLAFLRFMLSGEQVYDHHCNGQCWRWMRHDSHS
jgi:hypothetical protein